MVARLLHNATVLNIPQSAKPQLQVNVGPPGVGLGYSETKVDIPGSRLSESVGATAMMRRSTVLLSATVGFGLLNIAAVAVLGSTPGAGADGQAVDSWFRGHGDQVRVWMWLLALATPLLATFAPLVRAALPAPHGDMFFFGAIAFAAETAVQGWFWLGMASAREPVVTRDRPHAP
jgi:hypothetical protein